MKKLICTLLLLSQNVSADWFCTTESGQRLGNTIQVCGIGDSLNDEGAARRKALVNAIQEFQTICALSVDCLGKKTVVEPKRTQCVVDRVGLTKCYRLIEIRLVEKDGYPD